MTPEQELEKEDYIAYCTYQHHEDGHTTIDTCDSDAKGAFKVCRYEALLTARRELRERYQQIETLVPKADAYEGVCRTIGIKNNVLGYIADLKGELETMKGQRDLYKQCLDDLRQAIDIKADAIGVKGGEMNAQKPSLTLLIKLGSIIVHADETFSPDGRNVDKDVTLRLIADPEVQRWIKEMGALLPLKRISGKATP